MSAITPEKETERVVHRCEECFYFGGDNVGYAECYALPPSESETVRKFKFHSEKYVNVLMGVRHNVGAYDRECVFFKAKLAL